MSDMSNSSSFSGFGAPGKGPGAAAGGDPPALDVAGMLQKINAMRLDAASNAAARHAATQRAELRAGLAPSGPRRPGQGCEEQEQGIQLAEPTDTGGVRLRVTLLAAGFLIGPIGSCIREISRISGADVRSRTVAADARCPRDCREFTVEGADAAVAHAMSIMADAVKRYKSLCEGGCVGQVVSRSQHVAGVEFFYQPPPRSVVPNAACLKGHSRRGSGSKPTASKVAVRPVALPKGSPLQSPTFKDAVAGGSGDEAESPSPPAAGERPALFKRAASASPRLMAGDALFGGNSDILDGIASSGRPLAAKVSNGGEAEAAAFAHGPGLPVSLGLSEGPDGRIMVPLDLLLASQTLLAQGGGGGVAVPALGGGGGLSLPQQQTYPAGDLLSALASRIDAGMGLQGGLGGLDSHTAAAVTAAAAGAPPSPGVPFFGHYQAPAPQIFPVVHFQEGNFESGAQNAQHAQQASVSAFAAVTTEASPAEPHGKPPLSPGFQFPSTLACRAASLPAALGLGAAAAGPPPGFTAGDDSFSLRSAFHVPGLFRGHAMGPSTPAPSRAASLASAFNAGGGGGGGGGAAAGGGGGGDPSAAPSLERAISGSLFQASDGSAAIAAAAAAGHHRVAAAAWGPGGEAPEGADAGATAADADMAPAAPLLPNIWAPQ